MYVDTYSYEEHAPNLKPTTDVLDVLPCSMHMKFELTTRGVAEAGQAWLGLANPVLGCPSLSRFGQVWPGLARTGLAWQGPARPGVR